MMWSESTRVAGNVFGKPPGETQEEPGKRPSRNPCVGFSPWDLLLGFRLLGMVTPFPARHAGGAASCASSLWVVPLPLTWAGRTPSPGLGPISV